MLWGTDVKAVSDCVAGRLLPRVRRGPSPGATADDVTGVGCEKIAVTVWRRLADNQSVGNQESNFRSTGSWIISQGLLTATSYNFLKTWFTFILSQLTNTISLSFALQVFNLNPNKDISNFNKYVYHTSRKTEVVLRIYNLLPFRNIQFAGSLKTIREDAQPEK
jgi:hypothetical protein